MAYLTLRQKLTVFAVLFAMFGVLFGPEAMAGTNGDFDSIYTTLKGWAQGSLGKVIAVGAFIVGIAAGIAQQSIMAAVIGIGMALVMYYGPTVMENIVTAVI